MFHGLSDALARPTDPPPPSPFLSHAPAHPLPNISLTIALCDPAASCPMGVVEEGGAGTEGG